ncbi:MAG: ABC transporter substrate-binding protein [Acidimicrobiales bacterium]
MPVRAGTAFVAAATAAISLAACGGSNNPSAASSSPNATPTANNVKAFNAGGQRGGVLRLVGNGDVDFFDTADGYYDVTYTLWRAITRQLYTWPTAPKLSEQINPVPDLATAMPKVTNGGKTYTVTIRKGAFWNTTPPRQVTAQDEITGMKRLCNPISPTGAPGYFEDTIVGMKAYCNTFLKLKLPTSTSAQVTTIDNFMASHNIAGLKATGPLTIQFTLTQPAPDFIDILSLPFSSPVPKEELAFPPGQLGMHLVSDGPYTVQSYTPKRSIDLVRNPAWNASTDPIRKAYVNEIKITEGVPEATSAVQQVEAGTQDMFWDQVVPPAQLAGLVATKSPLLVIGPNGNNFITINPYLAMNLQSPNNHGALKKLKVRQAIEYAINKAADSALYGGKAVSAPLDQVIPNGSVGYIPGYDPYPTPGDKGNPAKAKALLAQAGYKPGQITLRLVYRTNSVHPQVAQADQAALDKAGFNVKLVTVNPADAFYTKYLENPTASKAGSWDIAEAGWIPDWMGNNGRSVIEPLFDGRTYGPNTTDFGDYNSPVVNKAIDHALAAKSTAQATKYWQDAARQVMKDAAVVPMGAQKTAVMHSSRVQNCDFYFPTENCDVTNVWLKG